MLTIIPNSKAMDYDKLISFLNKRKNIELNRLKQRGNEDVKDIEYRINKETNRPELLESLWNGDQYVYERYDDAVETHNLSDVIDYLFTHLNEFPRMTQRQFIDHLTDELDKRFGYID